MSPYVYTALRYCVPTSLPCRMPCVGSWFSQNAFNSSSYETTLGSNTTTTTSAWPVRPLQASSYVAFGVKPPAYPTAVVYTPGIRQNTFSAPQKHPMPNTAVSIPSGNGGSSGGRSRSAASAPASSASGRGARPRVRSSSSCANRTGIAWHLLHPHQQYGEGRCSLPGRSCGFVRRPGSWKDGTGRSRRRTREEAAPDPRDPVPRRGLARRDPQPPRRARGLTEPGTKGPAFVQPPRRHDRGVPHLYRVPAGFAERRPARSVIIRLWRVW